MNAKTTRQDTLRKAAEAQFAHVHFPKMMPRPPEALQYELQVSQIELEMQNEELHRAQVALEESRNRFTDLYDFAPVGYLTLNHKGMIDEINLTGAALLGAERNNLSCHRFVSFVATEDQDRWHRHFLNVLTRDDTIACELKLQLGDGTHFNAHLDCLRLKKEGKEPVVRVVLIDITRRYAIENALDESSRFLSSVGQHKQVEGEFQEPISAISHEISTSINCMIGLIDVLQQSNLNGSQMEIVNIIQHSVFALPAIINDFFDFSNIQAGKLHIEYAPVCVAEVMEEVCENLIPLTLKKGVELTLFIDPAIPAAAMGDSARLRQILVNLANNAIKYSSGQLRQGKVSVRAVLVESTPEQVTLEFRVTDNGIGHDEAGRLSTPFAMTDATTTRTYDTGLGLTISRHMASIMGGEITVDRERSRGSLYSLRLSLKLPTEQIDVGLDSPSQTRLELVDAVRMKPGLQTDLLAKLPCLVSGSPESLANDLSIYLVHAGAVVERAASVAAIKQWIASRPPGLCVVVIDTTGTTLQLDELRAAARAQPDLDTRFVVIGRGKRRHCRSDAPDLVTMDGNVLYRPTFVEGVAIAAGRAEQPARKASPCVAQAASVLLSREEAHQQGRLILIAENRGLNQKVILQQLLLLGQTAEIASDGREALELWQSGDYGLLLTDLHMPEMDGYELTAAIRAAERTGCNINKARMPIIAIAASALKGEAVQCRAIGMDDYLSKPVRLANLKAVLEKWLPDVVSDPMLARTTPIETALPALPGKVMPYRSM